MAVDDNRDIADLLAALLQGEGYVVVAHDGPTALSRLETMRPDVAVLGIGLPRMDGIELARRAAMPAPIGIRPEDVGPSPDSA